jgi:hypothetical protein
LIYIKPLDAFTSGAERLQSELVQTFPSVFELAIGHPRRILSALKHRVLEDDGRSAVRPRRNRDYSCALCPLQGRQEAPGKEIASHIESFFLKRQSKAA